MMGSMSYRSRHIRIDLLSKDEYAKAPESGKLVIDSQLYEVDEMLPSPKVLICSKCHSPGHFKRNCKSPIDLCRRVEKTETMVWITKNAKLNAAIAVVIMKQRTLNVKRSLNTENNYWFN